MASLFGNSAFIQSDTGSAAARAIKIADIYVKTRTNSAGQVSDPSVYDQAIAQLAPYSDNLNVQKKIAAYQNSQKAIQANQLDQTITLSDFKRGVSQALFTKTDSSRDISSLAFNTSVKLDDALNSLNVAIQTLQTQGKSTDQLEDYRIQLSQLANAQRDLVNKFNTGTADPKLDGYAYYVHTNPTDGSILGAAILPTGYAPSEITNGLVRIQNSAQLGNSQLPVYVSAYKQSDGSYTAKIGQTQWVSDPSQKDLLVPDSENGNNLSPDASFDIKDSAKYPLSTGSTTLKPGQFGRVVVGQDNGETKFAYFYKGMDGSIRSVDQDSVQKLAADPLIAKQLGGYVPLLSPDDVSNFKDVKPFDDKAVAGVNLMIKNKQAAADAAAAQTQLDKSNSSWFDGASDKLRRGAKAIGGFFSKAFSEPDLNGAPAPAGSGAGFQQTTPASLLNVSNTPNKPNTPAPERTTSDTINKGNSFFRNLA